MIPYMLKLINNSIEAITLLVQLILYMVCWNNSIVAFPLNCRFYEVKCMAHNDNVIEPNLVSDQLGCFTHYGLYLI